MSAQRRSSIPKGVQNISCFCTSKSSTQANKSTPNWRVSTINVICNKVQARHPRRTTDPSLRSISCASSPANSSSDDCTSRWTVINQFSCPLIDHWYTLHQLRQNAAGWQRNFWIAAVDVTSTSIEECDTVEPRNSWAAL